MAFSFDSLSFDGAAGLVLLTVAIWSWWLSRNLRAGMRVPLRFASVMLAALAVSLLLPAPGLAFNVALIVAAVASVALALAFRFRPGASVWFSPVALAISFGLGLGASLAGVPLLSFVAVAGTAVYIAVACFSRARGHRLNNLMALLGAMAMILGGAAMIDDALAPAALFLASALGFVTRGLKDPIVIADARIELFVSGERA